MIKLKCFNEVSVYPTEESFELLVPHCFNRSIGDIYFHQINVNQHGIIFTLNNNKSLILNPKYWAEHFKTVQENLEKIYGIDSIEVIADYSGILSKLDANKLEIISFDSLSGEPALRCVQEFVNKYKKTQEFSDATYYSSKYQLYCWANYYFGQANVKNETINSVEKISSYAQSCELAVSNHPELAKNAFPKSTLDKCGGNLLKASARNFDDDDFLSQKKIGLEEENNQRGHMQRCIFDGIPSNISIKSIQ